MRGEQRFCPLVRPRRHLNLEIVVNLPIYVESTLTILLFQGYMVYKTFFLSSLPCSMVGLGMSHPAPMGVTSAMHLSYSILKTHNYPMLKLKLRRKERKKLCCPMGGLSILTTIFFCYNFFLKII